MPTPRQFCYSCDSEIAYQPTPYICYRSGVTCPPHRSVSRRTPGRRKPPEFAGPDLNELLGLKPKQRKDRPASRGKPAFRVDLEVGPVAGRLEWRSGTPRPARDT